MKKIILTAVCMLIVLSATAQEPQVSGQGGNDTYSVLEDPNEYKEDLSQVKKSYRAECYTSIRAGVSIFKFAGGGSSTDNLLGYNVGAFEGIPVYKNVVFTEFGIALIQKGGKTSYYGTETKSNPNYLEFSIKIPVMYHFTKSVAGQVDAGIYYDQGIFGKTKITYDGGSSKSNIFGSKSDNNSSDFGFALGAGLTFSESVYLGFDYEIGLLKLNKDSKQKNRGFCVCVGVNI